MPTAAPMPHYHAELLGSVPEPNKTMQKDRYQVVVSNVPPKVRWMKQAILRGNLKLT